MTASDEAYGVHLAASGRLKLRAKKLLALGSAREVFDASVLLHEAARVERLAVQALPSAPPATRLSCAVEVCSCLLEGLDPPRAAEAWAEVLRLRDWVDAPQANAIVERLADTYPAVQQQFARTVGSSATLRAIREAFPFVALTAKERIRARNELAVAVRRFPGASSLHWAAFRLAEADDDKRAARDSLEKARQLEPGEPRFRGMTLLVAAWARSRPDAEKLLASVRPSLSHAGAEVCLMYAHAELTLARRATKERAARWARARDAADAGIHQVTTEAVRRNLRATQLLVRELMAHRIPTTEILYRAGLSELACATTPQTDIVALLNDRMRRTGPDGGAVT
jgi:hypothetical protein